MINLDETFEKFGDDFLEFDKIENKLHPRPDICAFLLLDKLVPNPGWDMVCASKYDEFYLDTDTEKLSEVATEDDILMLVRCGVMYDGSTDSLAMFT